MWKEIAVTASEVVTACWEIKINNVYKHEEKGYYITYIAKRKGELKVIHLLGN